MSLGQQSVLHYERGKGENNMNSFVQEQSSKNVILMTIGVMLAFAVSILLLSSPGSKLLGESQYAVRSAFHGLFAGVFMITATIGLYQAFRLWAGVKVKIRELEIGSMVNAMACFLAIVTGNWLYIPYRAPGGPRTHFLETDPQVHRIFFEFKEFTALFTLPLAIAAAYIICRYGQRIANNRILRESLALLLILTFFYFVLAFGLGAAITKLKSV
jgi:hypothetical protein